VTSFKTLLCVWGGYVQRSVLKLVTFDDACNNCHYSEVYMNRRRYGCRYYVGSCRFNCYGHPVRQVLKFFIEHTTETTVIIKMVNKLVLLMLVAVFSITLFSVVNGAAINQCPMLDTFCTTDSDCETDNSLCMSLKCHHDHRRCAPMHPLEGGLF
jgi:hypothetical protein